MNEKKEVSIKGKVGVSKIIREIYLEFGRVQADMCFSLNGSIQRKLRLKDNDEVEVIIRKL